MRRVDFGLVLRDEEGKPLELHLTEKYPLEGGYDVRKAIGTTKFGFLLDKIKWYMNGDEIEW